MRSKPRYDVLEIFTRRPYRWQMPRIRDVLPVPCGAAEAESHLEKILSDHRSSDGVSRIRLHVPVHGPAKSWGITVDREVRIAVVPARDASGLNDVLKVRWAPEGPLIFPSFEGTLAVGAEGGGSYLELDGHYKPPFGLAGELFDEAIGRRIAQVTAREFLADLRSQIEAAVEF